jgi:hypothetical protein
MLSKLHTWIRWRFTWIEIAIRLHFQPLPLLGVWTNPSTLVLNFCRTAALEPPRLAANHPDSAPKRPFLPIFLSLRIANLVSKLFDQIAGNQRISRHERLEQW